MQIDWIYISPFTGPLYNFSLDRKLTYHGTTTV